MHVKRHRTTTKEKVRNTLLVILAIGMVIIFFNLDITRDGESVFSKSSSQKLRFSGDLKRNAYTDKEIKSLLDFIDRYGEVIEKTDISVILQDSYKKVRKSSQLIFEVNMVLDGGTTINTPTWRTTRDKLVNDVLTKMKKDMKAYLELKEKGKKMKSLVNTK